MRGIFERTGCEQHRATWPPPLAMDGAGHGDVYDASGIVDPQFGRVYATHFGAAQRANPNVRVEGPQFGDLLRAIDPQRP